MRKVLALILALVMCASCFAFAEGEEVIYGRVKVPANAGCCNVYQLPGDYRPVISTLTDNAQVIILYEGTTWHKIQLMGSSLVGWMKSSEITISSRGVSALNMNSTVTNVRQTRSSDGWAAVRWGAGFEYDTMTSVPNGTYCCVFERVGDWSRVMFMDGKVGYVYNTLLTGANRMTTWPAGVKGYVQVSGDSANFRDGASYSSGVIGQLHSGDVVEVLGDNNGFLYVSDGTRAGYLSQDIISPEGINRTRASAMMFYDHPMNYSGITDIMLYIPAETTLKILATDGAVSRVEYNGIDGYIFDTSLVY